VTGEGSTDISLLHAAAIKYAQNGIHVFPLVKYRDMAIVKWREVAITDLGQINAWWGKGPECNIGIVTGKRSGIVVIDFATPDAWALAQEKGVPVTPVAQKGQRYQMYCKYEEGKGDYLKRADIAGVDLIGDDRMVVAPPSVVIQNPELSISLRKVTSFDWVDGKGIGDLELGDVPDWLLGLPKEVEEDRELVASDSSVIEESARPEVMEGLQLAEMQGTQAESEETDTNDKPALPNIEELDSDAKEDPCCETESLKVVEWKAPILFDSVKVEHIKAELLPSWLGEFAGAISRSKQTPEGLAVMFGLSIVAASVQKKFVVAPYGDDEYTEQLSLWTVTVLKSGERKSAVLNPMRNPLVVWEKEQAELLQTQIHDTETAINIAQMRIDKLQKNAGNEADAVARQGIVDQISDIRASMPVQVKAPVLWTADVTPEALQDLLAEHDEKMALLSDEGNIFEIMAGLYSDGKLNIDIFLQAYSGCPTKIMRKTRKVNLDKPALTFGLAVQPVVIESLDKSSKKGFKGKGALGRFLFCLPESMLGKRSVGDRTIVPADIKARYESGIRRLLTVPMLFNAAGKETPRMLVLDRDALGVWMQFDASVERMLGPGGELESMDDWGGKLPGSALRIAGILHLVEHGPDNLTIGIDTLNISISLCNLLISHAKAAYGMIGADEEISDAKKIFLWMQKNGFDVFTKTDCSRAFKTMTGIDNALKALEERNVLKQLMIPTGGRDAANYVSNPSLKPIVD